MVFSAATPKKVKTMNYTDKDDDDMEMQFSLVLSFTPPLVWRLALHSLPWGYEFDHMECERPK